MGAPLGWAEQEQHILNKLLIMDPKSVRRRFQLVVNSKDLADDPHDVTLEIPKAGLALMWFSVNFSQALPSSLEFLNFEVQRCCGKPS